MFSSTSNDACALCVVVVAAQIGVHLYALFVMDSHFATTQHLFLTFVCWRLCVVMPPNVLAVCVYVCVYIYWIARSSLAHANPLTPSGNFFFNLRFYFILFDFILFCLFALLLLLLLQLK